MNSTYKNLKLIIAHNNAQYESGEITEEEYKRFKEEYLGYMDTFLMRKRISNVNYDELFDMFITFEDEESAETEATA